MAFTQSPSLRFLTTTSFFTVITQNNKTYDDVDTKRISAIIVVEDGSNHCISYHGKEDSDW